MIAPKKNMAKPKRPAKKQNDGPDIELNFDRVEDMPALHVNNLLVQFDPTTFYLYFSDAPPPLIDAGSNRKYEVTAKCVAKVAIPAARMGSILKALNENFESYKCDVKAMIAEMKSQNSDSE